MIPLFLIVLCCFLSCKSLPPVEADSPAAMPYEGGALVDDDEPSLALIDESTPLESGEDFLPELFSEPEPPVIVEDEPPLASPPPAVAEDEPPPETFPEQPVIAEDEPPSEPPSPAIVKDELPSESGIPPSPPRIVRPAEPIPPSSPARTPGAGGVLPLPVNPMPDLPAQNPPAFTPEPVPVSSRIVRAMVGQTIEVPFRLTGWVYLGESASQRGIRYISRRLDTEGQTFIFQAGETGAYELKFYRQDFIRDYIINDLVTLIVEDAPIAAQSFGAPVDRGRVVAEPRWPSIAGEAIPGDDSPVSAGTPAVDPGIADDRNSRPSAPSGVVPGRAVPGQAVPTGGTASSAVPGQAAPVGTAILPEIAGDGSPSLFSPETSAEEYLRRAREEYDAGHIPQAIAVLDQFMARFPLGSDEALWLYGQMYEAPGSSRNIRSALDCYRRLINEYPQSNRYADARRRIAYLERYYINIQ